MKTRVFKGFFFQRIGECVVYVKDTTWHWGFDPEFWAHFCMDFFSIILHRIISSSKLRFYNALNNFEKKEVFFFWQNQRNSGLPLSLPIQRLYSTFLWGVRDLYRATPAVTCVLGFRRLIQKSNPSHLLRHASGIEDLLTVHLLQLKIKDKGR